MSIKKVGQDGEYHHFFDKKKFFFLPFLNKLTPYCISSFLKEKFGNFKKKVSHKIASHQPL
jgi:hypothetical protein